MNTRKMLLDGSEAERVLACALVMQGGIGAPKWAIPLVTRLLTHSIAAVRGLALEALSEIEGDIRFAEKAAKLLSRESDKTVRALAAEVVERWPELGRHAVRLAGRVQGRTASR